MVHYIRRDAPPLFYHVGSPGSIPPRGIFLCVGPRLLLLSGSSGYAVFKNTRALALSSDSLWAPKMPLPPAQDHQALLEKTTTSLLTASRADRLAQGLSLNNLATTTTPTVVDYNLNFKLRARPPALNLGLDRFGCTGDTVQLALFGTTAVSVSLISIFPDRKNLHYQC